MKFYARKRVLIAALAVAAAAAAAARYRMRERAVTVFDVASLDSSIGRRVRWKGVVTSPCLVRLYDGADCKYFLNVLVSDATRDRAALEIPNVGHEVVVTGRIAAFSPTGLGVNPPQGIVSLADCHIRDLGAGPTHSAPATAPAEAPAFSIKVTAGRDRWLFEYDDRRVSEELHLPESGVVLLRVTSSDVLHGMQLPLSDGVEAMPGRVTESRVAGGRTAGQYRITCTEYCGPHHFQCGARVIVESDSDFQRWLARVPAATRPAPNASAD